MKVEIYHRDGSAETLDFTSEEAFRAYLKAHDGEIVGFMELAPGQPDSQSETQA